MITKKIATAIATGAVLLNALAPMAFADTSLVISGNGSNSDNTANVSTTNNTTVVQDNNARIDNNISVNADTGHNRANDNTNGDVSVDTGDANTSVKVVNAANANHANVDACCSSKNADVLISGNGSDSDNRVRLNSDNNVSVFQDNNARIRNDVDVDADTGHNRANDNTGGDVSINTGNADTRVALRTFANANSAVVGNGNGNNGNGTVSAKILGNGTDSDNRIRLDLDNDVILVQDNNARINNDVDVDADTGHNHANDNTGGDVSIDTGGADSTVEVDNLVNFNGADIDACGCLTDLFAKISGNGSDSDNRIRFDANNNLLANQDNNARLNNDADVDAETGWNHANDNTGEVAGISDPSVRTGDADSTVKVGNHANLNTFGSDLGDLLDNFEFNFDFDFSGILGLFMGTHK